MITIVIIMVIAVIIIIIIIIVIVITGCGLLIVALLATGSSCWQAGAAAEPRPASWNYV